MSEYIYQILAAIGLIEFGAWRQRVKERRKAPVYPTPPRVTATRTVRGVVFVYIPERGGWIEAGRENE